MSNLSALSLEVLFKSVSNILSSSISDADEDLPATINTDAIMDGMVLFIIAFFLGIFFLLTAELLIFLRYFSRTAILPPPKFKTSHAQLPETLKIQLENSSLKQKEECIWLNFLLQFLFSELKDSLHVRRFLTKKIQLEFEEVLKSRSGLLVDELFLRDFHLGDKFPVILSMAVDKSDVMSNVIQTLDLKTRVIYDGGFQIAIDAALPFHRMAYVSVTVLKLHGLVRLQFTQLPFSHWSLSFYEEPELELDVMAQLDGRPMPKLSNIIANQVRKIIRRKHTLPMYKMRFKPFFQPLLVPGQHTKNTRICINGAELGCGFLEVTVIEASRLPFVVKGAMMYCTVSVDELPWKDQMMKERKLKKAITVELVKNSNDQHLGMTLKDDLLPDRLHPVVIIEEISVGSPAHMANVEQGDILVAVGENKVTSAKQAMKNLKWAKDKIQILVERSCSDTTVSEDEVVPPKRASSWHLGEKVDRSSTDIDLVYSLAQNASAPPSASSGSPKMKAKTSAQPSAEVHECRKTKYVPASTNPYWHRKFVFYVDSKLNYLNVCLWSKGGDRSGKHELINSTKQDVLLGYVSLNLDEIYLHCLVTLSGTLHDRVKLKHGHYKTEDELIKLWSVHKGWDPNQMYGDISLGFHYIPTQMNLAERQALSGCKENSAMLHKTLAERYQPQENGESKPLPSKITEDLDRDLNEGHHQFDSTTFMTATFCDYCGKKIWMKEAFKCQTCSMVCHKKCLVKCLVNTICTEGGVRKRSAVKEAWEPLTAIGRTKRSNVTDEPIKAADSAREEDLSMLEGVLMKDTGVESSESLQNLCDAISSDPDQKGSLVFRKHETSQDTNPVTRFRALKEQTDRMKDNVLKHLRRNKVPTALNDKAIMSAKVLGARLYLDMDVSSRKDKLEDLVKKLDEELKAEMENKETLEQDLAVLEDREQSAPNSKRKSEMKTLNNKIFKSIEKQDAMRLLMLQYCSGLQNCFNSLEADVKVEQNSSEFTDRGQSLQKDGESSKTSRSAAVGGFVRRASSSVKERMSFIKKKGTRGRTEDKTMSVKSTNNNGLTIIDEKEDVSSQESMEEGTPWRTFKIKDEKTAEDNTETEICDAADVSGLTTTSAETNDETVSSMQPEIEIRVDEPDINEPGAGDDLDPNEPSFLNRDQSALPRSSSDSRLEICKMLALRPEDILHYRGTSLPRILANNDSDSESDYLVIDSSDEPAVTDSSESDHDDETVAFEGGKKNTSHDGSGEHHNTIQQLQTFHV